MQIRFGVKFKTAKMHIICVICSDFVNQAENIYVTKCGHVFHHICLSQWIARSKSCPQCRSKVTDKCMYRLYPTIANETTAEDITIIQSRLDDAQLELLQQRISTKEKDDKLAAVTADLKKKKYLLTTCEKKLQNRENIISSVRNQLEYHKIQTRDTKKLREENKVLKYKIQLLNGLQMILSSTSNEVEEILEGYSDVKTVATFAVALKKELCNSESKIKESKDRLKSMNQQLSNEKSIVSALRAQLLQAEQKLSIAQSKYENLESKQETPDTLDRSLTEESWESAVKQMRPSDESSFDDTIFNEINFASSSKDAIPDHPRNAVTKSPDIVSITWHTRISHRNQPTRAEFDGGNDVNISQFDISLDEPEELPQAVYFPTTCTRIPSNNSNPRLTTKRRLKRATPSGSQDISNILKKKRNN